MASSKVQDVEVTVRWHNVYLGCAVLFFSSTVLFAGLFGHYYSEWSHRSPCDETRHWVFGNSSEFDGACHVVGDDGLYAIAGADCPSECDAWWHARHPTRATHARRLFEASFLNTHAGRGYAFARTALGVACVRTGDVCVPG